MLWSIIISSTTGRYDNKMACELEKQIGQQNIELLIVCDNDTNSPGTRRDKAIGLAQGQYVTCLDCKDKISADYVAKVSEVLATAKNPDCIRFDSIDVQHTGPGIFNKADNQLKSYHIYRRELIKNYEFGTQPEEEWCELIEPNLSNTFNMDHVLYYCQPVPFKQLTSIVDSNKLTVFYGEEQHYLDITEQFEKLFRKENHWVLGWDKKIQRCLHRSMCW